MTHENIRKAITAAQAEIDPVLKIKKEKMTYKVIEFQDVVDAVRPAMVKHGVIATVVQNTIHSFDRVVVPASPDDKYGKDKTEYVAVITGVVRFSHGDSDTSVDATASISAVAFSDKVLQIAGTNLLKVALMQTFLVQAEDEAGDARPQTTSKPVPAAPAFIFGEAKDQALLTKFNEILDQERQASAAFKYKTPALKGEALASVYKVFEGWMDKDQFKAMTTLMADGRPDDPFWNAMTSLHDNDPLLLMLAGKLLNK